MKFFIACVVALVSATKGPRPDCRTFGGCGPSPTPRVNCRTFGGCVPSPTPRVNCRTFGGCGPAPTPFQLPPTPFDVPSPTPKGTTGGGTNVVNTVLQIKSLQALLGGNKEPITDYCWRSVIVEPEAVPVSTHIEVPAQVAAQPFYPLPDPSRISTFQSFPYANIPVQPLAVPNVVPYQVPYAVPYAVPYNVPYNVPYAVPYQVPYVITGAVATDVAVQVGTLVSQVPIQQTLGTEIVLGNQITALGERMVPKIFSTMCQSGAAPIRNNDGSERYCGLQRGGQQCPRGTECTSNANGDWYVCCPSVVSLRIEVPGTPSTKNGLVGNAARQQPGARYIIQCERNDRD